MAITAIAFLPAGGSASAQTRDTFATSSSTTVSSDTQSDQFSALIANSESSLTGAYTAAIAAEATARDAAIAAAVAPVAAAIVPILNEPNVRLTMVSGVPFVTTTQTAKTAIYMTPAELGVMRLPSYNGSAFVMTNIAAEQMFTLDSNAAHTGYHQNGKNYDLWWDDAGQRLVTGPAWSSDTARAAAIATLNGWVVNSASMVAKYDTSANTATIAASRALHLGAFRCSADGQTQHVYGAVAVGGTAASFLLSNRFNRTEVGTFIGDSTGTWTYTSVTIRPANNKTTMRASYIDCRAFSNVFAQYVTVAYSSASDQGFGGVGLDSTTAFAAGSAVTYAANLGGAAAVGLYTGTPGIGYHFLQALESGNPGGSFDGGAAGLNQSGLTAVIWM